MIRTRIAPSPTGEYHIGHLRTMLYNYAWAKKHGGEFIIRIEDTDRTRFVEGSMERTLQAIKDYGLSWDEGPEVGGPYEPYLQSQRLDVYVKHSEELIEHGHAYYCFCTPERLANLRQTQQEKGLRPMYDGHCRDADIRESRIRVEEGEAYVVRLKVPRDETISFEDAVLGSLTFDSNEVDDQVLLKSDGFPTYHLAVVVDDHLMKITHIMRGTDWVPSTPKHVLLYRYFGWEFPVHAHLPNLKEVGGTKKLSKRFGAVTAREFLDQGYLPEAMLNFLMLLGWNPGTDQEIFSLEEFVQAFDIEDIHKTDLVAFDREKLAWMNGVYIRQLSVDQVNAKLRMQHAAFDSIDDDYLNRIIPLVQERMRTLGEFDSLTHYFFKDPQIHLDDVLQKGKTAEETKEVLVKVADVLNSVSDDEWNAVHLEKVLRELQETLADWSPKQLFMTLRVALTGETATPPLFDVMEVLGRERIINRMMNIYK